MKPTTKQTKQTIEEFAKELQQLMDKHKVVITPYCCDCCCQSLSLQVVDKVPTVVVHGTDSYYALANQKLQISLIVSDVRQPTVSVIATGKAKLDYKV